MGSSSMGTYLLTMVMVQAVSGSSARFWGASFLLLHFFPLPRPTAIYYPSKLFSPTIWAAATVGHKPQTLAAPNALPRAPTSTTSGVFPFGCPSLGSLASSVKLPCSRKLTSGRYSTWLIRSIRVMISIGAAPSPPHHHLGVGLV